MSILSFLWSSYYKTLFSLRNADLLNLLSGKIPHPSKSDIVKRSIKYVSNARSPFPQSLVKFTRCRFFFLIIKKNKKTTTKKKKKKKKKQTKKQQTNKQKNNNKKQKKSFAIFYEEIVKNW